MVGEKQADSIQVVTTDGINMDVDNILLSCTEIVDTGYRVIGKYDQTIEEAKRRAANQLRQQAFEKGCYAVVGIKYEFVHFVVDGYVHTYMSAYATGLTDFKKKSTRDWINERRKAVQEEKNTDKAENKVALKEEFKEELSSITKKEQELIDIRRLKEFKSQFDAGIISEEEFRKKKHELIDSYLGEENNR